MMMVMVMAMVLFLMMTLNILYDCGAEWRLNKINNEWLKMKGGR